MSYDPDHTVWHFTSDVLDLHDGSLFGMFMQTRSSVKLYCADWKDEPVRLTISGIQYLSSRSLILPDIIFDNRITPLEECDDLLICSILGCAGELMACDIAQLEQCRRNIAIGAWQVLEINLMQSGLIAAIIERSDTPMVFETGLSKNREAFL